MTFGFGIGSPGAIVRPFNPLDVANAGMWIDAEESPITFGVGSLVAQINDLSPNGRNEVQATGAKQLLLSPNIINAKRALLANGVNSSQTAVGATFTTITRFLVAKYASAVAAGTLCDGNAGGGGNQGRIYRTSATQLHLNVGAEIVATTTPEVAHVYCIVNAAGAGNVAFYIDNVLIGTATASGQFAMRPCLATFGDGASDPANAYYSADIAYPSVLSAADRTRVWQYLKLEYGTP